jgi:hypothetical protein
MLGKGKYESQLNLIEFILKHLDFLEQRNRFPASMPDISFLRKASYPDNWKILVKQNYFHFQLKDNSLFYFLAKNDFEILSYSYYECPFLCLTYEEFLGDFNFDPAEAGHEFYNDYEIYLDGCEIRSSFAPIRYDYDPNAYRQAVHPASHIHIGASNEIRIGCDKILEPISFFLFVIRQIYPSYWTIMLRTKVIEKFHTSRKRDLQSVKADLWNEMDFNELHLV